MLISLQGRQARESRFAVLYASEKLRRLSRIVILHNAPLLGAIRMPLGPRPVRS